MKKFLSLLAASLLTTIFLLAQDKVFTPQDVVGMNPALYAKNLQQLQWMRSSDTYSWVDNNNVIAVKAGSSDTLTPLSLSTLNRELLSLKEDTLRRLPPLQWKSDTQAIFWIKNTLYSIKSAPIQLTKITSLPDEAENIELAANSMKVAYTLKGNVYVFDGNVHQQVTDNPEGVVSGQTVHRNEFGIEKGLFWSPDESMLAFYRMDQSMVTDYPLVDIAQRMAAVKWEKYPMAGTKSHHVTIGVYALADKLTRFLQTGEPAEQYLTAVTWQPDSKAIFTAILNREQNHMSLKSYDSQTGAGLRTVFEEKDEKYVEPQHPLFFLPGSNNLFIWMSERDGFRHMYLYQTDGTLISQLTSGTWEVTDLLAFDPKGTKAFYQSTQQSPLQLNTWEIDIKTRKTRLLTPENGTHRSMISPSGKYMLDSYSSASTPRKIQLIQLNKLVSKTLLDAPNPLEAYALGKTSIIGLNAVDGTPLFGRIILPVNFDAEKKYPVIVYVYGGPHAQLITDSWLWGAGLYLNYLSQKGYIVFTLDNRGSDHRGQKFEQAIHRQVGKAEMEDQMTGIAYLKTLPYVDANRIGVDGWSYGGFMSINLKLTHPEVFKVATAGGPVIDWKYYEIMYGERYMDQPEENPDGYAASNLILKAPQLEGKLLIMHGDMDPVVLWQNSLSFLKACVDAGKQVDYFVYPGHEHNVRGKDRAHLIQKITTYFDENL